MLNLLLVSQPRSGTHFLGNLLDLNDQIIFDTGERFIYYNTGKKKIRPTLFLMYFIVFVRNLLNFKFFTRKYLGTTIMIKDFFITDMRNYKAKKYIILFRKSILKQFLSWKVACKTDNWEHSNSKVKIEYNENEYNNYKSDILRERAQIINYMIKTNKDYYIIYYEDINEEIKNLSNFLDVKSFNNFDVKYKKQEKRELNDIIY